MMGIIAVLVQSLINIMVGVRQNNPKNNLIKMSFSIIAFYFFYKTFRVIKNIREKASYLVVLIIHNCYSLIYFSKILDIIYRQ
jgi:hypothetical protein